MKLEDRVAIVTGARAGHRQGRSPTSWPTEGASVVVADVNGDGRRGGRARGRHRDAGGRLLGEPTSQRWWTDTVAALRAARRAGQQRRHRPVHGVGRHRLRGVAPDHGREPRRHLPVLPPRPQADARGGLRAHRQHLLQRRARRHPEPGALRRLQGRHPRVHPRAGPRDRQVRDHRERRGARASPRPRGPSPVPTPRRSSSSRCCSASRGAAWRPTSHPRWPSSPPRSPAGSPGSCWSPTRACPTADGRVPRGARGGHPGRGGRGPLGRRSTAT